MRWDEIIVTTLKAHRIDLVTYVPDNVLKPVIERVHGDTYFTAFTTTREEEALGIISGAGMAGRRGIAMMQSSGFATLANVLASLSVPYELPTTMLISERGTLGEFNIGQSLVCRTMRPVLDSLGIETMHLTRLDELEFIADRSLVQAYTTRRPVAFILSPLLTGGNTLHLKR